MVAFPGRVEARLTVPTGGAAYSASSGALSSAYAGTIPAASYYLTAAGSVSSLLTTLQTQLNESVQGYPQSADAMRAAVGYGKWTAGWLMNETVAPLVATFGAPNLTAVATPIVGNAGPRGGIDKSVAFDGDADAFTGGNVHNVGATDDLVIAAVIYPYTTAGNDDILGKGFVGGAGAGYYVDREGTLLAVYVNDGVDAQVTSVTIDAGAWYGVLVALDRSNNLLRIGLVNLSTGAVSVSSSASTAAIGSLSNANAFNLGDNGTNRALSGEVAALYVGTGAGAASGLIANLSTALTNFANAINSSFSVAMSTSTGLITVSNSFWPSYVQWTSTALRDVLGFAYNFDYPQTAAQMAAAVGYGTWTSGAGWLCNDTATPLVAAFGTPSLTAVSTPTYSNYGPRGGSDKAVGFDSASDAFNGGDVFDVGATDDLILAWVGKFPAIGPTDVVGKYGVPGYIVIVEPPNLRFFLSDGTNSAIADVAATANEWYVAIAVVDRSTGKARIGYRTLVSGVTTVSFEASTASVGSLASAFGFSLGANAVYNSSSAFSSAIAALYVTAGSGVATGLSANLSTALSNFATYMRSQTGTQQARGLWFPDCPLSIDADPAQAPRVTDLRSSMSPTGQVLSLVGNSLYRHKGITWSHVPRARTWESAATYANASYETFAKDCLYGLGHEWFRPSSPVQIYWDDAGTQRAVGYTYNSSAGIPGWSVINVAATEPRPSVSGWTGLFRVEWPEIVSSG